MTDTPLRKKICVNCLEALVPKKDETHKSDTFRLRIYCSPTCSVAMQRRIRHGRPHPAAVQLELDARKAAGRMDVPALRLAPSVAKSKFS